jgi:two-component system, response regulator RegA
MKEILVLDDDERFGPRLADAFTGRGHPGHWAANVAEALVLVSTRPISHGVVDLRLGEESGLVAIREILARAPECRLLLLTGYGSIPTAVDAVRLGAVHVIQKPADADDVLAAFARAEGDPLEHAEALTPPSLDRAEWEHLQRVLADCDGNISEAARRLRVHRRTLQRKLQKHPPRG